MFAKCKVFPIHLIDNTQMSVMFSNFGVAEIIQMDFDDFDHQIDYIRIKGGQKRNPDPN